jgi:hypothetical protein
METQSDFGLEELAVDAFLSASAVCVPINPADTLPESQQICEAALTLNAAYMGELLSDTVWHSRNPPSFFTSVPPVVP